MQINEELPVKGFQTGEFTLDIHRGNHARTQRVVPPLLNLGKPIIVWKYYTERVTQKIGYRFDPYGVVQLTLVEFPNVSPISITPELCQLGNFKKLTELYDNPLLVGWFMSLPKREQFINQLFWQGELDQGRSDELATILDDIKLRSRRRR